MALVNSLFSRLFGSGPEDGEEEEALLEAPAGAPEPAEPEPLPRHELTLSENHSLHKLWSLYNEQSDWLPKPQLFLEEETDPIMPEMAAKTELLRLQMSVNSSANQRFEKVRASQQSSEERPLPNLDVCPDVI